MSKSLQDQLLSLGLASKKSAPKRSEKASGKSQRRSRNPNSQSNRKHPAPDTAGAGASDGTEMSLDQAYALRKREEQKQAAEARKQKQEEIRRRRRLNKEIGAIVNKHRQNDPKANVPRNFMYKGRIRKIYLTEVQLKSLNEGKLGLAYLTGSYHLLDSEHIDTIRELSAEHVPDLGGESPDDEDHPVPDDLIW
jgi:uncharacterized protein YaiL (DUF2058 family)